jgi:hypothetical protein
MAMIRLRRIVLCAALVVTAGIAAAQAIEVIELRHRTAEELLPLIEPHLPDSATATGVADRLIVKAQPREIARLRSVISELDKAPRSLLVTVRGGGSSSEQTFGFGMTGWSDREVRVHVHRSESARSDNAIQQVRGLEGRPVRIATQSLLPVTSRLAWIGADGAGTAEQTTLLELEDGFYALPRLQGDRVEVELSVQDRSATDPLRARRVVSTISGAAGEWIPFARADTHARENDRGLVYRSEGARHEADTLWIRVQPLD